MTRQKELDIIIAYDPMIRKIVYNFMNRCSVRTIPSEDLMQEARIVFLNHIRTHRPEDYGSTILHALSNTVLHHY